METVKGIILDYGGTIDTNSRHWAEVLWEQYVAQGIPVEKSAFREAYVYGERTLAKEKHIYPEDNFRRVLYVKTALQFDYLISKGFLPVGSKGAEDVAERSYAYVLRVLEKTRPVLEKLATHYPLVLVSNFYGNIHTILEDFGLSTYFSDIVESSIVGLRKPDPAIYALGVERMGLPAQNILVIGDSFSKDVVPAKAVGCQAVWLQGEGWGGEEIDPDLPDYIISDLTEILTLLHL